MCMSMRCCVIALLALGCAMASAEPKGGGMRIQSLAFDENTHIPSRFTGEGEDISPGLEWTAPPAGTKAFALICDDPDAPAKTPWTHWVLYQIPAEQRKLPEGMSHEPVTFHGLIEGRNSWGTVGYRGPLPPKGHGTHHYVFTLYALDTVIEGRGGLTREELLALMKGHVIASAQTRGTYERR